MVGTRVATYSFRERGHATMKSFAFLALAGVMLLSACVETPMGSTVQVMPGPNTSLASFQNDQATCRQFAQQAVADQAQGANLRGLGTAALTTALGAGLGGRLAAAGVQGLARRAARSAAQGWARSALPTLRGRSKRSTTTLLPRACLVSAIRCLVWDPR